MPNANTVRSQVGGTQVLTLAPLLGTTITTTATAFQLNANALTAIGGGYNGASNGNAGVLAGGVIPLSAGVTGLYAGTGRVLHVAFTGTYSGATSGTTTLVLTLYEVPASVIAAGAVGGTLFQTFTGWNSVAATSAKTLTGAVGSYSFDARLQLDSAGNLDGSFTSQINSAAITSPAASTQVTGLVGEADLNFAMVATLGGAETGVILTPGEFRIDLE